MACKGSRIAGIRSTGVRRPHRRDRPSVFARTDVRQMLCGSRSPVSSLSAAMPYEASRRAAVPGSITVLSRADVVPWRAAADLAKGGAWPDTEEVTGSNPVAPTTQSSRSDKVSVPALRDLRRPLPHLGAHLGHARAHGCHAWALSQTPPTGSRRPDRSCRRTMRHGIAVILGRGGGSSKPQRRLGWLHRLVDHAKHLGRQRVQVDLLT
jgi:hypothetical protein